MNFNVLVRRFIAFIIDWNIMFGGAILIIFCSPGFNQEYVYYPSFDMFNSAGLLFGFAWLILYCLFKDCLFNRRSIGKLICGLVIRNTETNEIVTYRKLILRNITYIILQIEFIILLINNGKRLGDIIAKTHVDIRSKNPDDRKFD